MKRNRGVFRTQSNIKCKLFLQKNSIFDVGLIFSKSIYIFNKLYLHEK